MSLEWPSPISALRSLHLSDSYHNNNHLQMDLILSGQLTANRRQLRMQHCHHNWDTPPEPCSLEPRPGSESTLQTARQTTDCMQLINRV